eukprot:scaffold2566_cov54-Phaeocystis_antarctica.AAC.3
MVRVRVRGRAHTFQGKRTDIAVSSQLSRCRDARAAGSRTANSTMLHRNLCTSSPGLDAPRTSGTPSRPAPAAGASSSRRARTTG